MSEKEYRNKEALEANQFTPDKAREAQAKGVEQRKRNKKTNTIVADAVRAELNRVQQNGKTVMENIVAKTMKALFDNPSVKDVKDLQTILGEEVKTVNVVQTEQRSREEAFSAALDIEPYEAGEEEGE